MLILVDEKINQEYVKRAWKEDVEVFGMKSYTQSLNFSFARDSRIHREECLLSYYLFIHLELDLIMV